MQNKGSARLIGIIAVVALIIATGGYLVYSQGDKSTAPPKIVGKTEAEANGVPVVRSAGISVTAPASSTPTEVVATYKDGTWKGEGSYAIPEDGETEKIGVSVTLKDGIIVDSTVTEMANDNDSVKYQNIFIKNYKQYVTGKSIDEVKLDKVSGSSLTSAGFNAALDAMKLEAKG